MQSGDRPVSPLPGSHAGRTIAVLTCTGLIFLVLVPVLLSGCTEPSDSPEGARTPVPVKMTASPAADTPLPEPTVPPAAKMFGNFRWVEYRENITQTLSPNPRYQWETVDRLERSETGYKGTPAIREKITVTMDYAEWSGGTLVKTKDGWVIVSDRYYGASTEKFLGGTWSETIKGEPQAPEDLPADKKHSGEDLPRNEMGIAPFGELNITLEDEGTESVTVPAGSWPDARRFSGTFRDGTPVTFWIVHGIPVPVQYRIPNRNLDGEDPIQTYELRSWG